MASRAIGQGLAKVEPNSPNLLIAYSAKAGSTAADGDGKNSPFTVALSKHLTRPGLDVRRAFGFVRDDVLKTTNNRQEPFVYGSLGGDDVPLVPAKMAVPAPPANPRADMRHDYELALQIGNKSALNAFLAQYPDGFYASLAKLQLEKLAAEETRVVATEKARVAEEERARLASEGAQKATQAKAESDARAAEQARIAAEKAKQVAQAQAAAAEQKRIDAEKAAADTGARVAALSPPAAADKTNLASLSAGAPPADVTKSVQSELRRVGCLSGDADGNWSTMSQRSLSLFNRYANTKLDTKLASIDALDTIKTRTSRVCPLVCDHGYKSQGETCVKIVCAKGSFLNDDNECEKRREKKPVAKRERLERPDRVAPQAAQGFQAPQARQAGIGRAASPNGAGLGQRGQALTGTERELGCNSRAAIMSGVCP